MILFQTKKGMALTFLVAYDIYFWFLKKIPFLFFYFVNHELYSPFITFSQGNYVALNENEINELNDEEYELKIVKSYETLANAGAHYVIDSIAELPPVIEDINRRLAAGERP